MNVDNFADYLAQPARLYQLPYQEIKNLVAEYPYSANLRLLLALKSKLENDPKFDQYIHQLAAHTTDRAHLKQLIEEELHAITDLATEAEERLELKALEELQDNLVKLPAKENQEEPPPLASTIPPAFSLPVDSAPGLEEELAVDEPSWPEPAIETSAKIDSDSDPVLEQEALDPAAAIEVVATDPSDDDAKEDVLIDETPEEVDATEDGGVELDKDLIEDLVALDESLALIGTRKAKREDKTVRPAPSPAPVKRREAPAPLPPTSFSSWQRLPRENKRDRFRKLRQKHQNPGSSSKMTARKIAKQSIKQAPGLVSETLARLLAEQGQHDKAIRMYQQLSLLFPEKSRYFAGIIKNLKQNS